MKNFTITLGTVFSFLLGEAIGVFPFLYRNTLFAWLTFSALSVLWFIVVFGQVYGHTLWEWFIRRLRYKKYKFSPSHIASVDGKGRIWDGETITFYVAVTLPPFTPSRILLNGEVRSLYIPVDKLRSSLVQYDILVDNISVYTYGYKYAQNSPLSTAVNVGIGPVGHEFWGNTFVSVSIGVNKSLDSITLRAKGGDRVVGVHKTAALAAERVRRELERVGFKATIVTEQELKEFSHAIANFVSPALAHKKWKSVGDDSTLKFAIFSPKNGVLSEKDSTEIKSTNPVREWRKTTLIRTNPTVNSPEGVDSVTHLIAYASTKESDFSLVSSYGLNREFGTQDKLLSQFLPFVCSSKTVEAKSKQLSVQDNYSLPLYPSAIGVYLGLIQGRDKLFLSMDSSSHFIYVNNDRVARMLALRCLLSGQFVDVEINTAEWIDLVKRTNDPLFSYRSGRAKGIVFTTEERKNIPLRYPGTCVIVVNSDATAEMNNFAIISDETGNNSTLITEYGNFDFDISISSVELPFINPDYMRPRSQKQVPQQMKKEQVKHVPQQMKKEQVKQVPQQMKKEQVTQVPQQISDVPKLPDLSIGASTDVANSDMETIINSGKKKRIFW